MTKKKGGNVNTETEVGSQSQPQAASYSRWAMFERDVLTKVGDADKCMALVAERQQQVDDDANEAELVASFIRMRIREDGHNPESCCFFFTTGEITGWVQDATGSKLPINKTTPYLRTLAITELRYSARGSGPGWVWQGKKAKANATALRYSKLRSMPPGSTSTEV
ncbi:MAG: hypothetical protein WCL32_17430 [Planctomycetota bacterium]